MGMEIGRKITGPQNPGLFSFAGVFPCWSGFGTWEILEKFQ
jgi:hypothetical protein